MNTYQRIHDLSDQIARRRVDETKPQDFQSRRDQLREILERTGLTAVQEAELHLLEEACEGNYACEICGADIGPSAYFVWHNWDEDCRAVRDPVDPSEALPINGGTS